MNYQLYWDPLHSSSVNLKSRSSHYYILYNAFPPNLHVQVDWRITTHSSSPPPPSQRTLPRCVASTWTVTLTNLALLWSPSPAASKVAFTQMPLELCVCLLGGGRVVGDLWMEGDGGGAVLKGSIFLFFFIFTSYSVCVPPFLLLLYWVLMEYVWCL